MQKVTKKARFGLNKFLGLDGIGVNQEIMKNKISQRHCEAHRAGFVSEHGLWQSDLKIRQSNYNRSRLPRRGQAQIDASLPAMTLYFSLLLFFLILKFFMKNIFQYT
jgi:hypothetical protein